MAQNLSHYTLRLMVRVSKLLNPRHHLMPGDSTHIAALGNENILGNLLVIRNHKPEALAFLVIPNHLFVGMLQHFKHRTFSPSAVSPVLGFHHNLDPVPVKGRSCPVLRDKHILLHAFHGHKTKALGMSAKNTVDRKNFRFPIFSLLGNSDSALRYQIVQYLCQFISL